MLIAIDAGHGGNDPGATAAWINEADIALNMALMLNSLLTIRGYETLLIRRRANETLTLTERTKRANDAGAGAFVSMHCNAAQSTAASGFEVFAHPDRDRELADQIALAMHRSFPERRFRRGDEGPARLANFAVLRTSLAPAALVEPGFLSNEDDRAFLVDRGNQLSIAEAVADGVMRYANSQVS